MLSPERRAELRAVAEKATPGPWSIQLAQEPGASVVTAEHRRGGTVVICEIEVAELHNGSLTLDNLNPGARARLRLRHTIST